MVFFLFVFFGFHFCLTQKTMIVPTSVLCAWNVVAFFLNLEISYSSFRFLLKWPSAVIVPQSIPLCLSGLNNPLPEGRACLTHSCLSPSPGKTQSSKYSDLTRKHHSWGTL